VPSRNTFAPSRIGTLAPSILPTCGSRALHNTPAWYDPVYMTEDQFEKLAQLIQSSHEDLSGEIQRLEHKMDAGFERMDNEFAHLRTELKDIRTRLDALEKKVGEHSGYSKEIDHILSRIVVLEQRLGISQSASE